MNSQQQYKKIIIMKRLKHNMSTFFIYSMFVGIVLIPLELGILPTMALSVLIGFLYGILNDILTQLRKLNEK